MTPNQELMIESAARTTSVISLVGCVFILLTFALFPTFRKPINRLIVYASIGNILTNTATVVSVAGIPSHGASWALCRFQGFFIQMFMPADSFWTLCMALNVYLTFFKNYNAVDLRGLEVRYFVCCYGIPFIPALIYLILDESSIHKGIYGDAVLWCWVDKDWEWMRIAFFYGPVWCVIVAIVGIYSYTGKIIFKQRKALRAFSRSNDIPSSSITTTLNTTNAVTAITEVVVTSESIQSDGHQPQIGDIEADTRSSFSSTKNLSSAAPSHTSHPFQFGPADTTRYEPDLAIWPYADDESGPTDERKNAYSTCVSAGVPASAEVLADFDGTRPNSSRRSAHRRYGSTGRYTNNAALGYAKVAFLMFVALFVVWMPSTVNRVYSLAYPNRINCALNFTAALVLPTQGFWNFVIYVSTSWSQCKDACEDLRYALTRASPSREIPANPALEMSGALRSRPMESDLSVSFTNVQRMMPEKGGNVSLHSKQSRTDSLKAESLATRRGARNPAR